MREIRLNGRHLGLAAATLFVIILLLRTGPGLLGTEPPPLPDDVGLAPGPDRLAAREPVPPSPAEPRASLRWGPRQAGGLVGGGSRRAVVPKAHRAEPGRGQRNREGADAPVAAPNPTAPAPSPPRAPSPPPAAVTPAPLTLAPPDAGRDRGAPGAASGGQVASRQPAPSAAYPGDGSEEFAPR